MQKRPALLALAATVALALVAGTAAAERGDDAKRKSKNGKAVGTIDGVEITIEYGRPEVRDRTVWGGLVPYGKVWRTGADECSTITFGSDAVVEGQPIEAGTYGLFTIPAESEWTVIFNRAADQWGAFEYDEAEDALRVQVEAATAEHTEAMEIAVGDDGFTLRWAEVAVPVSVGSK